MSISGFYPFGELVTKSGKVINFDDIDIDNDGKISQKEFNFIQKELGVDIVEISGEKQKGEKDVTDFEFVFWQQEAHMQNTFNLLCAKVATDFIGTNAQYSTRVLNELREFMNDFKAENSSDPEKVAGMADSFAQEIMVKYNDLKESILGAGKEKDYEKIQKEWEEFVEKFERDQNNAGSIKEYVQLGRDYLSNHSKYIQKMLSCKDLDSEMRKPLIEEGKADIETAKMYTKLMSDGIEMQSATENFISKLEENCPGWKDLEDNPIVSDPDLYMLRYSQTFEPSVLEPSMTQAYRKTLQREFESLKNQYDKLVAAGKINTDEQIQLKPKTDDN